LRRFDMEKRDMVQEQYGRIAQELRTGDTVSGCCGSSCTCSCASGQGITDTAINYADTELSALPKEAVEASLGCANPLVFAQLKEGDTVLDLGSGGGIDVLIASTIVGDSGRVYGLDMTDEMLKLANENKVRMGVANVEFLKGYIEDIPLKDELIDVIISNCVINLTENKQKALCEAHRVLKKGGRLRIADVVSLKEIPEELRDNAALWCGCLAGTVSPQQYESVLQDRGFSNIKIMIEHVYTKEIILSEFLGEDPQSADPDRIPDMLDGAFAGALISADK